MGVTGMVRQARLRLKAPSAIRCFQSACGPRLAAWPGWWPRPRERGPRDQRTGPRTAPSPLRISSFGRVPRLVTRTVGADAMHSEVPVYSPRLMRP